jgi:uncharacterized protein YndB with AHSA1/START domain
MTTSTLTIRRQFTAPPARVYDAWTTPDLFAQWIGPVGVPCTLLQMDPTEGGSFRLDMHPPDGQLIRVAGQFTRLSPHAQIDFTWGPAWTATEDDPAGSIFSTVTIHLRPHGTGTEMEFHHHLPDAEMVPSHRTGWSSAFDKLHSFLET